MITDRQTLKDLEIFECRDGRSSLFDRLDRTRTPGGRTRLKERFRRPMSGAAEIGAVQEALRFVVAHREAFERFERATEPQRLAALDAYLHSRYTTSTSRRAVASWVDALWTRLRYRAIYDEAHAGVNLALAWVDDVGRLAEDVASAEPPRGVAEVVERIASITEREEVRAFVRAGYVSHRSPAAVLRQDRRVRERLKPELLRLVEALHELDALVSMADAVREMGLVFPVVEEGGEGAATEIRGVRHPFVAGARPNDLRVEGGGGLLFLTGPNMAGKTTYLKACGVAVYLAHLGMGVPAEAMRLSPFAHLFTGINTEDNVRLGYSYFYSEVRRVKEIARVLAGGARAFVLFDEMFKGTNVKDACDATLRVAGGFARARGSVFLVSSHLVELAEELGEIPGVALGCFDAEVSGGELRYSYALKPGASAQRLGMVLLEREGVFEALDSLAGAAPRA